MIYTTLNRIAGHHPCQAGWKTLLRGLGKFAQDDEPLGFDRILGICGADDALWCTQAEGQHNHLWRAVAVKIARTVQGLMISPYCIAVLDVAERHAFGLASDQELQSASGDCRGGSYPWGHADYAAAKCVSDGAHCAFRAAMSASEAMSLAPTHADRVRGKARAMSTYGAILLSAVSSCYADPGCLGVRLPGGEA